MNTYTDKHKTIVTAEAIEPNRRVKLNGSQLLVYAGAGEDYVGVSTHYAASGAVLTIKLPNDSGTNLIEAAGTFAAGAIVYGAADGKIDDTVSGDEIGQALEAATAAQLIEVLKVNTSDVAYLDGITPGTVTASKAVVVDANKDIASFNDMSAAGLTLSDLTATTVLLASGTKVVESSAVTPTELSYLDLTGAVGTVEASKALVVDASKDISSLNDVGMAGTLSMSTPAAVGSIAVDAGTINHAADGNVVDVNVDVEGAYSVNAHNVNLDFETTGMGAADVSTAFKADINELVVHTNGAGLHGTDVTLTGFASGRCDLVGNLVTLDGSKTAGDTSSGVKVISTQTINHSGEVLYGNWVDFSGATLTDGTVYGNYTDVSLTNGSTSYGHYLSLGTDTTAGIVLSGTSVTGISIGASTTGISFANASTSRAIDIQITPTSAEIQLYMNIDYGANNKEACYIIASSAKTSSETTAGRFRAQGQAVGSSTAELRGIHAQGIASDGLFAGTVNGVYAESIAKATSTVTTIRGAMIACDSEGTPTAIGTMMGAHIRVKTSVAPATLFIGARIESEKFGAGVKANTLLDFKTTTWTNSETALGSIIDMTNVVGIADCHIRFGTSFQATETTTEGDFWYDAAAHTFQYYNGSNVKTIDAT